MLLQMFSSMATQDREVLVTNFKGLLGDQLSADECAFFLDMNNWNLQAAICSYFELQQDLPGIRLPNMSLIHDETSNEILTVPPNIVFHKTWHISNPAHQAWPPGCCLKFVGGTRMSEYDRVMVDALPPSTATEVIVVLTSPADLGSYRGEWRMSTISGFYFGEPLHVTINVSNDQVFDGLVSGMSRASLGSTDNGDIGQMSRSHFLPGTPAQGPTLDSAERSPAVLPHPDSLSMLATRQANVAPCESEADSMEMS